MFNLRQVFFGLRKMLYIIFICCVFPFFTHGNLVAMIGVNATENFAILIKLFGGITGSGSGFITAFLLASGKRIAESVILTGISCEPVDKTIQCLLAFWFIRTLPLRLRERLEPLGYLKLNQKQ